jgi:hypothetical protein
VGLKFSVETAEQDWAGNGRVVEATTETTSYSTRHGMRVTTKNGWTFSAIWGYGSYCTTARSSEPNGFGLVEHPPAEAPNAEVAIWKGKGSMLKMPDGDSVAGYVHPDDFQEALKLAEADDLDAATRALCGQVQE